ncbi:MAG: hypothetical protein HY329_23860 [Chloroflexi bacterium]|nr:hypothetical protein [Chloroflexota bacterium]
MTRDLQRAVAAAASLPTEAQDALAALVPAEIEASERWEQLCADRRSQALSGQLAAEAPSEDSNGETEPAELGG